MNDISTLKNKINTKTINFLLLSFVTAGIYPLLWLYRNQSIISEVTKSKITDDIFIIWIAVCGGLGGALSKIDTDLILVLSGLLSIASTVLYIVWTFKTRKALQNYALNEFRFEYKMNIFYTIFLNIYYINYCINDLPDELQKQQILNGQTKEQVDC